MLDLLFLSCLFVIHDKIFVFLRGISFSESSAWCIVIFVVFIMIVIIDVPESKILLVIYYFDVIILRCLNRHCILYIVNIVVLEHTVALFFILLLQ